MYEGAGEPEGLIPLPYSFDSVQPTSLTQELCDCKRRYPVNDPLSYIHLGIFYNIGPDT